MRECRRGQSWFTDVQIHKSRWTVRDPHFIYFLTFKNVYTTMCTFQPVSGLNHIVSAKQLECECPGAEQEHHSRFYSAFHKMSQAWQSQRVWLWKINRKVSFLTPLFGWSLGNTFFILYFMCGEGIKTSLCLCVDAFPLQGSFKYCFQLNISFNGLFTASPFALIG